MLFVNFGMTTSFFMYLVSENKSIIGLGRGLGRSREPITLGLGFPYGLSYPMRDSFNLFLSQQLYH
jgi:hypothetical protein